MTRQVSPAGFALIKAFEGCVLKAYPDPGSGGDPWTVGWGSTGSDIKRGVCWTQAQADARLEADVQQFAKGVYKLVGDHGTQHQFDALVSFVYNLGLGSLPHSTLLRLHNEGDYGGAQLQFSRWNRAGGRVLPGLTERRLAEAKLYGMP